MNSSGGYNGSHVLYVCNIFFCNMAVFSFMELEKER